MHLMKFTNILIISIFFLFSASLMATTDQVAQIIPDGTYKGIVKALDNSACSISISEGVKPLYGNENNQNEKLNYSLQVIVGDHLNLSFLLVNYDSQTNGDQNSTILTYENLERDNSKYQLVLEFNQEDIISYKISSTDQDLLITCRNLVDQI